MDTQTHTPPPASFRSSLVSRVTEDKKEALAQLVCSDRETEREEEEEEEKTVNECSDVQTG